MGGALVDFILGAAVIALPQHQVTSLAYTINSKGAQAAGFNVIRAPWNAGTRGHRQSKHWPCQAPCTEEETAAEEKGISGGG